MNQETKSVLMRFVRGAVSGAVAMMILVAPGNISNGADLSVWLNNLMLAGIVGFIGGVLLAVDKWARME
jgi:hypothetical protein